MPVGVVRPTARAGNRLILAQRVAEAGASSPVARAVAEPLDRCDACAYGEDAGREVVYIEALPTMHRAHAVWASIYAVPQIRKAISAARYQARSHDGRCAPQFPLVPGYGACSAAHLPNHQR